MNLKVIAACGYLGLVYLAAGRVAGLHPLFFPALGAFTYLMITRRSTWREMLRMTAGAFICSFVGTMLSRLHPSSVFLVVDALLVFLFVHRLKFNFPPIIAVSLIPFFSHFPNWWTFPASGGAALLGLTLTLSIAVLLEKLPIFQAIPMLVPREKESSSSLAKEEPA